MDLDKLAAELGFDAETVKGLIATFLDASAGDMDALERAVSAGDAPAAARLAHHIKGAAANLELTEIAAAALAVETAARSGSVTGTGAEMARIKSGLQALRLPPG